MTARDKRTPEKLAEDRRDLEQIMRRSIQGQQISSRDQDFITEQYRLNPTWYSEIHRSVKESVQEGLRRMWGGQS